MCFYQARGDCVYWLLHGAQLWWSQGAAPVEESSTNQNNRYTSLLAPKVDTQLTQSRLTGLVSARKTK